MRVTLRKYIENNQLNPETPTGLPWETECDPDAELTMIYTDQTCDYTTWMCADGTLWTLVEDSRAPHSFLTKESPRMAEEKQQMH